MKNGTARERKGQTKYVQLNSIAAAHAQFHCKENRYFVSPVWFLHFCQRKTLLCGALLPPFVIVVICGATTTKMANYMTRTESRSTRTQVHDREKTGFSSPATHSANLTIPSWRWAANRFTVWPRPSTCTKFFYNQIHLHHGPRKFSHFSMACRLCSSTIVWWCVTSAS